MYQHIHNILYTVCVQQKQYSSNNTFHESNISNATPTPKSLTSIKTRNPPFIDGADVLSGNATLYTWIFLIDGFEEAREVQQNIALYKATIKWAKVTICVIHTEKAIRLR